MLKFIDKKNKTKKKQTFILKNLRISLEFANVFQLK